MPPFHTWNWVDLSTRVTVSLWKHQSDACKILNYSNWLGLDCVIHLYYVIRAHWRAVKTAHDVVCLFSEYIFDKFRRCWIYLKACWRTWRKNCVRRKKKDEGCSVSSASVISFWVWQLMRPSGPLIGEYGVCNSQDSLITRRSSRLMHLLLERLSRGVHVLAEAHAVLFSWKDGSSTQSLSTEVRASVLLHTDLCCNLFTSSCADRGSSGSTEVPNGSSVAAAVNAWLD